MKYQEKFNDVLNNDEELIKVYKPNKVKYAVSRVIFLVFFFALWEFFVVAMSFSGKDDSFVWGIFAVLSIGAVFVFLLLGIYLIFFYKNLFYCVTSQRVIVRRGVFGTDYKSLDMKMIGATNVQVSLLDKIVNKNTGSITFGSNSAPITAQGGSFMFKDIQNPYEESKEIKEVIDKCNSKDTKN